MSIATTLPASCVLLITNSMTRQVFTSELNWMSSIGSGNTDSGIPMAKRPTTRPVASGCSATPSFERNIRTAAKALGFTK